MVIKVIWLRLLHMLMLIFGHGISQPLDNRVNLETGQNLSGYDVSWHLGRTLKAIDWEACEFGDTLQSYDETCPNGATNLLPCNPGQLKVAECIGQGGDTSRVCDPCPQKFFQSNYNKCTRCHECSECGPNEQIRQPCTDDTDTVCESIIPPDPVPTTTSRPTSTQATTRVSTQSTTYTSMATTEISLAGTKSTHAVTYKNIGTGEIQTLSTTPAEKEEPKTERHVDVAGLAISVSFNTILFLKVVALLTITWKQRKEIKELKEKPGKSSESSGLATCSSGDHNAPSNDYEMEGCREFSQNDDESQPKGSMVQVHGDPDSNKGSPSKSLERQRSTGEGREDSGSGTGDSDGSCTTRPDKDDGGVVVDPPKPLGSATSRPVEQKSDEADPLMEKQAMPKKGYKRKCPEAHSLRIPAPGWKKSGNENGWRRSDRSILV